MTALVRGLALLLVAYATSVPAQGIYPGDAVRVNERTISYQRFHGFYIEYRDAVGVAPGARGDQLDMLTQVRRDAMDSLVEQELVAQAAENAGIETDTAEVDRFVDEFRATFDSEIGYREKLKGEGFTEESFRTHVARMMAAKIYLDGVRVDAAGVTDAELEEFYAANEARLTLPEQVRVRHILLKWKPLGTQDDRAALVAEMQPILERARSGEDFAALARSFSEDAGTREQGGDTGFFTHGAMVPPFEAAAFSLEPGEISDPVQTGYGVHIVKLEERREPRLLSLDEIRDQLREFVQAQKMETAVDARIAELRGEADIEILVPMASRN